MEEKRNKNKPYESKEKGRGVDFSLSCIIRRTFDKF